jgi:hypothetical protein
VFAGDGLGFLRRCASISRCEIGKFCNFFARHALNSVRWAGSAKWVQTYNGRVLAACDAAGRCESWPGILQHDGGAWRKHPRRLCHVDSNSMLMALSGCDCHHHFLQQATLWCMGSSTDMGGRSLTLWSATAWVEEGAAGEESGVARSAVADQGREIVVFASFSAATYEAS